MSAGKYIDAANRLYANINFLKENSNPWPEIFKHDEPGITPMGQKTITVYFSTLVRILRDDKWYLVHCVESYVTKPIKDDNYVLEIMVAENKLFGKLIRSVHNIQNLYIISPPMQTLYGTKDMQDLDPDQTPEPERIKNIIHPPKQNTVSDGSERS